VASLRLARIVASGFGIGYAAGAPGSAGSLAALVLGAGLLWISPVLVSLAALLAIAAGFWAVRLLHADDDPAWIVVDEFAGQWIAMLALPRPTLAGLLAAFVLFRLFDVAKPGPVGWADRRHGVVGVMVDDIIAGALAAALLGAARVLWPGVLG